LDTDACSGLTCHHLKASGSTIKLLDSVFSGQIITKRMKVSGRMTSFQTYKFLECLCLREQIKLLATGIYKTRQIMTMIVKISQKIVINKMDEGLKCGVMVPTIMAILSRVPSKVKEFIFG